MASVARPSCGGNSGVLFTAMPNAPLTALNPPLNAAIRRAHQGTQVGHHWSNSRDRRACRSDRVRRMGQRGELHIATRHILRAHQVRQPRDHLMSMADGGGIAHQSDILLIPQHADSDQQGEGDGKPNNQAID
jgi:hypothetical protein